MFKYDQPIASNFTITISNPHGPLNWASLHIGAGYMLETVTEADVAAGGDAKIGDSEFRLTPEVCEEVLPILSVCFSAPILVARHYIENNETFVRHIVFHDCVNVTGVDGRCKSI